MSTVGTIEVIAKIDTSQYKQGANEITSANNKMESSGDKTTSNLSSGFKTLGKVGVAALAAVGAAITVMLVKNIDNAVDRIDTLIAFPRVLKAMGVSAGEAESATAKLSKSLEGLPTPLQEGAAGVQALVSSGLDIGKATDVFLAFNNATLAASTEAGAAQGAFTQLVQSISKGKIEGQEWNSLLAAMPTAFQGLSKASGKSREELRELYRTNPQQLLDDLVKLNKEGGGGLASLEEQARSATGGIKTAFANMNTAITKGLVGIVVAIGGGDLEAGQKKLFDGITAIGKAFEVSLTAIGKFAAFLLGNQTAMAAFGGVVLGVLAAGFYILAGAIWAALAPVLPIIAAFALIGAGVNLLVQQIGGWSVVWGVLKSAATQVWSVLQTVGSFLMTIFKPAIDAMIKSTREAWASFQPLWQQIQGPVLNALKVLAIVILGPIVASFIAMQVVAFAVIYVIIKLITWVNNIISVLFRWASAGLSAGSSFISGIGGAINTAISYFSSLPSKIISALGNTASLLLSAGKNIMQGLLNGITGGISSVMSKVNGIASDIKSKFADAMKIKSPSKVFEGFGMNITQGLVQGIDGGMSKVDASVAGLSGNVIAPSVDAQITGSASDSTNTASNSKNITINMDGIMARSRSDLRDIAKDLVRSINEELQSKSQPLIGEGNI